MQRRASPPPGYSADFWRLNKYCRMSPPKSVAD